MVMTPRRVTQANGYEVTEGMNLMMGKMNHHKMTVLGGTPAVNVGHSTPERLGTVLAACQELTALVSHVWGNAKMLAPRA